MATPGVGPGHWVYPDYKALIENDPIYQAALASIATGEQRDASTRANTVAALLYMFGDPRQLTGGNASMWQAFIAQHPEMANDFTDAAIAAAGSNPYSYLANTALTQNQSNAWGGASAAARGVLQSGAYLDALRKGQDVYDRSLYSGTNTLLGPEGLSGAYKTWADAWNASQAARRAAMGEAATREQGLYPPTWVEDPTPGGDGGIVVGPGNTGTPNPHGGDYYGGVISDTHDYYGDTSAPPVGENLIPPPQYSPVPMVGAPVSPKSSHFNPNWLGIE